MNDRQDMDHESDVFLRSGLVPTTGQPVQRGQAEYGANERRGHQRPLVDVSSASVALLRLFDQLAYGLIVLDSTRQVIHINRAARGALARERRVRVLGRTLEAWYESDAKAFTRAMEAGFSGKRITMKIGESVRPTQGAIIVVPLPGTFAIGALQASQVGHVALVFERSPCAEALSIAFFARNHGLTLGEERVLRALNEDKSVGEVAGALGAAISTIRTHLNHIREKTGTRSLRALVANVRSVPPLMPAFGD